MSNQAERFAIAAKRDATIAAEHAAAILAIGAVAEDADIHTLRVAILAQEKWLKSLKPLVATGMKQIMVLKVRYRALKEDDEDDDEKDEEDEDEDEDEDDGPSGVKRSRV